MKKLLLIASLTGLLLGANAQTTVNTNITGGAGMYLVSTNRATVYSIEVSATNAATIWFYDNDDASAVPGAGAGYFGTNFVNAAYTSRTTYPTNIVTSYVGTTGFTNWYTNSGLWVLSATVAAGTNSLPLMTSVGVSANETRITSIPLVFTRGILVRVSGNAAITLYAR